MSKLETYYNNAFRAITCSNCHYPLEHPEPVEHPSKLGHFVGCIHYVDSAPTPRPEVPTCSCWTRGGNTRIASCPVHGDVAPSPDPERANPHIGSTLDSFLKEEGIADDVAERAAMERVIEAARRAMSGAGFYGDLEIAIAELDAYRAGRKGGAK